MQPRACVLVGLTAVFDGKGNTASLLLIDSQDKVIKVGQHDIFALSEFLAQVVADLREDCKMRKMMIEAQRKCNACEAHVAHLGLDFPYPECESCSNREMAIAAMEQDD